MSVLERIFREKPPRELFHYTNQEGLLGILGNNEIWASKIQYLNDSTELGLALAIAERLLKKGLRGIVWVDIGISG